MSVDFEQYSFSAKERFLRYVQIDTQSNPLSATVPSSEKQKLLAQLLVKELQDLGIDHAEMDQYGYVFATIASNSSKKIPVICFCAHMDTSPDCDGANVKPIVHENYDGKDIRFPDDSSIILSAADHPDLSAQIGNDIITASGTTLLGADNKAGVAAIMDAVEFWVKNPEVPHGAIRILFTIDEEIGRGVDHLDMKKLGADYGYTIDGEKAGSLEDENFCADGATLTVSGVAAHPGFGKGKLLNATKILSHIIDALPKNTLSPETTAGKEGFLHPVRLNGNAEKATAEFIIRDFTEKGLHQHEESLKNICENIIQHYPGAAFQLQIKEQYRNMKTVLDQHPQVVEYALEAIKRAGIMPVRQSIRGGTDGARLSFMGLPCPNIFAGEHAFHSKVEWVSVQDMQKAMQTIIHLAAIWEEKS